MDPIEDKQVWDIFSPSPEQLATTFRQDIQIQTEPSRLSDGQFAQTTPGTIKLLTRDLDAWLLPSEARLQVRFRVIKAGANLDANDAVTLVNAGYHIFSDMEIKLNNKSVDRIDNPGKVQLMHGYASYSAEYVKKCSDLAWFYPESALVSSGVNDGTTTQSTAGERQLTGFANANDLDVTEFGAGAGITAALGALLGAIRSKRNDSYYKRYRRTAESKQVELWLPLSAVSGFCRENNKVIRGMTMEVSLNRETDFPSILHGQFGELTDLVAAIPGGGDPVVPAATLILDSVSLWIPHLKPSLAMASHIEQQLANDAATKWVYSNMTVYQSETYPTQVNTQVRWLVTSTAHRPTLLLFGFQSNNQISSQNDTTNLKAPVAPAVRGLVRAQQACSNGGLFSSLADITAAEVRINSVIVPQDSYRISFLDETYKRAYYDFLKVYHKDSEYEACIMDEKTFQDSPIFAFDLRSMDDGIYQGIKTNNIEFRATVTNIAGAAPAGNFRIYAMVVSEVEATVEAKGGRLSIMP